MFFAVRGAGEALSHGLAAANASRTFSTAARGRASRPGLRAGGVTFVKIVAPASLALAALNYSTATRSLHAEGKRAAKSLSGTKIREVDRSAPRISTTNLVFMSHDEEHREGWQDWIGYFRVAGYNCVDLNVKLEDEGGIAALSEELGSQVRLLSLQRPPLVFAYSGLGAKIALEHIQSSRPRIGGLILVVPENSDLEAVERADRLDKDKLNVLLLDGKEDEQAIRTAERWMDSQGFS